MICQAILVTTLMFLATGRFSKTFAMPTCLNSCGDLTIPFPFGTSSDCSLDDSFLISCNHSYNPPRPFLNSGSLMVLNISLDGLIKVASSVASDCYDDSGSQVKSAIAELTSSKFPISSRLNKFTAIGCDTYALLQGSTESKQMSAGCVSWCDRMDRGVNGTCSGIGCCQSSIPGGVRDFSVVIQSFKNHTMVNSFNPCSYAFVVETESFNFSSSDLRDFQNRKFVPIVLDWSVGYLTCSEARKNSSTFACYENSDCIDSSSGVGYHCKCATGFQGNPYNLDGCQGFYYSLF